MFRTVIWSMVRMESRAATARNRHTSWRDIICRWEVVRSCMVMCR